MNNNLNKGIIAGILAGVFWGTPFLVPMVLNNFTSFEITFGRFLFFGLISLFNLSRIIKLIKTLSFREIAKIFVLSATGFWLYTLILLTGVKLTDGVIASLIIGCLPLTIIICSRPRLNHYLLYGLLLIILGIVCLLVLPILLGGIAASTLIGVEISGILLLIAALVIWTWFSISNSYFMISHQQIDPMDYSSLIGVISIIFIFPAFGCINGFSDLLNSPDITHFLIWTAVLGLGASWVSNIFWAYSAKNCPPSIGGALIISETIFGLIYSFIFEQRWPHFNEVFAIIFLIGGVLLVIYSQKDKC